MKLNLLAILLSATWISVSEFFRNQFILQKNWTAHYTSLGLEFPAGPFNGAVWGVWSLCLAWGIFMLSRRFGFLMTTILVWFFAFVLMWLVIGNLAVLPLSILPLAIPLSILEVVLAVFITRRISPAS
ncbi:MAG TPA: hypothetical protein PLQ93_08915 [Bacteroidia bacterium]|nr:hypothetical protein [Bacteroidia bacterium]